MGPFQICGCPFREPWASEIAQVATHGPLVSSWFLKTRVKVYSTWWLSASAAKHSTALKINELDLDSKLGSAQERIWGQWQ